MSGISRLIAAGTLLGFKAAAVDKHPGESCMVPMDKCVPADTSECGIVLYCKEGYSDCSSRSDSERTLVMYDYNIPPMTTGTCFNTQDDFESCNATGNGCLSKYCGVDSKCTSYCDGSAGSCDGNRFGKDQCISEVIECNDNYELCGSASGTVQYNRIPGSSGACYQEVGPGENCDAEMLACSDGSSCNRDGICELTCTSDSDCSTDSKCVFGVRFCDIYNNCELSGESDAAFEWLAYDYTPGGTGTCLKVGEHGDACDSDGFACSTDTVCKNGYCTLLCNDVYSCSSTDDGENMCIGHFKFCDGNYQLCSYDEPDVPNAEFTIIFEVPSGAEWGTCYNVVDMEGYGNPTCAGNQMVCGDLHCNDMGLCQQACDENRSCRSNFACLAYLEFCTGDDYTNCQLPVNDAADHYKYTTLEHSNETVGLCYQETSMYTPDCYDDIVCAHTRYCDGLCDEGYLLACTSDDQCDPLMRCMVVDGCDNNYQNCHDVTDVTLHYIDYDGDIPDHVGNGYCRYVEGEEAECDDLEASCSTGWCSPEGLCKVHCDNGLAACESGEICINHISYCNESFEGCSDVVTDDFVKFSEIDESKDEIGQCFELSNKGEACSVDSIACAEGLFCDLSLNLCVKPCQSGCAADEQCLSKIQTCDENFHNCSESENATIVYVNSTEDDDLCYDLVTGGTVGSIHSKCDLETTCPATSEFEGRCKDDGECLSDCHSETDCDADYQCITDVMFCTDPANCVLEYPDVIDYILYETGGSKGYCYKAVELGEACDVYISCKSGYCDHGTCDVPQSVCKSDLDCNGDTECIVVEFCESDFTGCSENYSNPIAHYIPIAESSEDQGYCLSVKETDESCDGYEGACRGHWCSGDGVCLNHCEGGDAGCDDGLSCVALGFCDGAFQSCSDSRTGYQSTITYDPAMSGSCVELRPIGETCDGEWLGCSSGQCSSNGTCVKFCDGSHRCTSADEVCFNDIFYCDDGVCGPDIPESESHKYYEIEAGEQGSCFVANDIGGNCDMLTHGCEPWLICVSGTCAAVCDDDSQCRLGEQCISGVEYCNKYYEDCDYEWSSQLTTIHYKSGKGGCMPISDDGKCDHEITCSSGYCGVDGKCQETCTEDGTEECPEGQQCLTSITFCDQQYKSCSTAQDTSIDQSIIYEVMGPGLCFSVSTTGDCDEFNTCSSGYCDIHGKCDEHAFACTSDSDCASYGDGEMKCYGVTYCDANWTGCSEDERPDLVNIKYSDSVSNKTCKDLRANGSACNDVEDGCESLSCNEYGQCVEYCSADKSCDSGLTCTSLFYCDTSYEVCSPSPNHPEVDLITYSFDVLTGVCLSKGPDGESCDSHTSGCDSMRCSNIEGGVCESLCGLEYPCVAEGTECIYEVEYCDASDVCGSDLTDTTEYLTYIVLTDPSAYGSCFELGEVGQECDVEHLACAHDGICPIDSQRCYVECASNEDCPEDQTCYSKPIYCSDKDFNDCDEFWASDRTVIVYPAAESDGHCLPPSTTDGCDEFHACEEGYCIVDPITGKGKCEAEGYCEGDEDCPMGDECYSGVLYCNENYDECDGNYVAGSYDTIIYLKEGEGLCRHANASGATCDNEDNACLSGRCSPESKCDSLTVSCTSDAECAGDERCLDVLYCDQDFKNCTSSAPSGKVYALHYEASTSGSCRKVQGHGADCDDSKLACDRNWCDSFGHTCTNHCDIAAGYDCLADESCVVQKYCSEVTDGEGNKEFSCTSEYTEVYDHIIYDEQARGECYELNDRNMECNDATEGCEGDLICLKGLDHTETCETGCMSDDDCASGEICSNNFYFCQPDMSRCIFGIDNTDPELLTLHMLWYDSSLPGYGWCSPVQPSGEICETGVDACSSQYCLDGVCRNLCNEYHYPCSDNPDYGEAPNGQTCVNEFLFCDDNYDDCKGEKDGSTSTIIYDIPGSGFCFDNADIGAKCDESNVCASGHCDINNECQELCSTATECEASCPIDKTCTCYSFVGYCNDQFENCTTEETSGLDYIKYHFDDMTEGLCYEIGDEGDSCSVHDACATGYCDGNVCINFAKICTSDDDCSEGRVCTSAEKCDADYQSCSPGVPGSSFSTLHYDRDLADTSQTFYCRELQPNGATCNEYQSGCQSGYCNSAGICENYCKNNDDCGDGYHCVSHFEYCDGFDCSSTPSDNLPFIQYYEGVGKCYSAGERGDLCDTDEASCASNFCNDNGKCAIPCYDSSDCQERGLSEVCITKIEYCAVLMPDQSGFAGCSEEPNEFATGKFYSFEGNYGICMDIALTYHSCNDYDRGCIGRDPNANDPLARDVCYYDPILRTQKCYQDVSTAENNPDMPGASR